MLSAQDIDSSDAILAINMSDSKLIDNILKSKKIQELANEVNSKPLIPIPELASRKIPRMEHTLLKRSCTHVPGSEAYDEVSKCFHLSALMFISCIFY